MFVTSRRKGLPQVGPENTYPGLIMAASRARNLRGVSSPSSPSPYGFTAVAVHKPFPRERGQTRTMTQTTASPAPPSRSCPPCPLLLAVRPACLAPPDCPSLTGLAQPRPVVRAVPELLERLPRPAMLYRDENELSSSDRHAFGFA